MHTLYIVVTTAAICDDVSGCDLAISTTIRIAFHGILINCYYCICHHDYSCSNIGLVSFHRFLAHHFQPFPT